ncbi:MAG: Bax inhibitor-1/YccA family protein [Candidatus Wallbacteria bacterium]|nr:Bax inhibitor-1/YccA family protein [Candidatus Wallbacteria bacterium]
MQYRHPNVSDAQYEVIDERRQSVDMPAILAKVYNWMAVGVLITGLVSMLAASSPSVQQIVLGSRFVFFGLLVGEIGLVWYLSASIMKLEKSTALNLFFLYSALNGLTMSFIFMIYARSTIASAFIASALMFGGMAVYGHTTKKDLTSMGGFLISALWGLIAASLVNFLFRSSALDLILSYAGVFIFLGLTAYDSQKIKQIAYMHPELQERVAVLGALTLYLDFINLFLHLLRIMGGRRR